MPGTLHILWKLLTPYLGSGSKPFRPLRLISGVEWGVGGWGNDGSKPASCLLPA